MRSPKKVIAALFFTLASAAAFAIPITDNFDAVPDALITSTSVPYVYTHDITDNGYSPLLQTITSAILTVRLFDGTTQGNETFTFSIGEGATTSQTFTGSNVNNGNTGDSYPITLVAALDDLRADGKLKVTLSAQSGDFTFTDSTLVAQVSPRGAVPEPGILALLGIGLLSVGVTRRQKALK